MFQSFFIGGFECSTHRGRRNNRHDLVQASGHDLFAAADFRRLRSSGITTVREGLRWHLIESAPRKYDFSSVIPIVKAARDENVQVLWDLFHYGFPDFTNPFDADFHAYFADFAFAFAQFLRRETDATPFICPFNEISFFAYAAGEHGFFAPHQTGRGDELKVNCARAAIAATKAVRAVFPAARIMQIEPLIHVFPAENESWEIAENYRLAQFDAYDMIAGRRRPEIGGGEEFLDIVGVNFYPYNQWVAEGESGEPSETVHFDDWRYRPLRELLMEIYERYQRPIFIAETGAENELRPTWLRYVCDETRAAISAGVPVSGICWYPILNHPGWDDDRHCHNGLWDYCNLDGEREIYAPLAAEIENQIELFGAQQRRQRYSRAATV